MNKNFKRLMGAALAFNAVSAFYGIPYVAQNTEAYAAESEDDECGIKSLQVNKGTSSSSLQLYSDSKYKNKSSFNENDKEYYAKTTYNTINLSFDAEKGYVVKAFKSDKDTATAYDSEQSMSIGSGVTTIYVRTYEKGDFDASDVTDKVVKEYEIYVNRDDGQKEDNDQDKIYLKDITLSVGNVDFNKKVTSYDVAVETGDREITIQAKPAEDGDEVSIDGRTVDDSDKYKKTVTVRLGKNPIKIKVSDDNGNKRIYTINILRGDAESANSSSNNSNSDKTNSESNSAQDKNNGTQVTGDKNSQNINSPQVENTNNTSYQDKWVSENGAWKYYDASGNTVKNTWFTDKNSGKQYYLYNDGTMATGWISYSGNWYYMGSDGAKHTGWVQDNDGNWYYLDAAGIMKTGWTQDNSGNWYYLYNTGIMAKNTVIDGYTLGYDGAWV